MVKEGFLLRLKFSFLELMEGIDQLTSPIVPREIPKTVYVDKLNDKEWMELVIRLTN